MVAIFARHGRVCRCRIEYLWSIGVKPNGAAGDNGGITLSRSFCATIFAHNLGHVRHMTVPFAVLSNGQTRPESLKIVASSGQPKRDRSALKTIRASVPFASPPKEITIGIAIAFSRKH